MEKWIKLSSDCAPGLMDLKGALSLSQTLEGGSAERDSQTDWMQRTSNIDARIVDFIRNHDFDHDRYTYVMVAPLGADESWEQTVNGDAFERRYLEPDHKDYGHRTFVSHGRAFMNHRNMDPTRSFGDFPLMVYNRVMDRCEGLWRLSHEMAEHIPGAKRVIEQYRNGEDYPISMGCKVPYDVCSLCGNMAEDPSQYCECVSNPGFGSINEDTGQKMRVFNPLPLFFDLSAVGVNAAPEASPLGWVFPELVAYLKAMSKTSSAKIPGWTRNHRVIVPSSYFPACAGRTVHRGVKLSSAAVPVKVSDMIKQIPVLANEVIHPLARATEDLTPEVLEDTIKSSMSQSGALSNLGALGIVLSPGEFRHLVMSASDLPADLWPSMVEDDIREGFESGPSAMLSSEALRGHVLAGIKDLAPERSILYPHLARRISLAKNYPGRPCKKHYPPAIKVRLDIQVPKALSRRYGQYIRELSLKMAELVREMLSRFPSLGEDLGAAASGNLSMAIDGAQRTLGSVKTSELAAQALLPSAIMLNLAGCMHKESALIESVDALNKTDTAPIFGGVYGRVA